MNVPRLRAKAEAHGFRFTEEARALHADALVFDLHVDPLIQHCLFGYDVAAAHEPDAWPGPLGRSLGARLIQRAQKGRHRPLFNHTDLPRLREGGYAGAAFGIHWWQRHRKIPGAGLLARRSWESVTRGQLREFQGLLHAGHLAFAGEPDDLPRAKAGGGFAGFATLEGWQLLGPPEIPLDTRLARLREAHDRHGVRCLTLNHHTPNDACGNGWSMIEKEAVPDETLGLSGVGGRVIRECESLGLLLDLSHTSRQGVLDACAASRRPVIVSHGGAGGAPGSPGGDRAVSHRLLDDACLRAVARTGGVIGLVFSPAYLSGNEDGSLDDLVRHARHIRDTVGAGHLALGSDFDGWITSIPRELDDCRDLPLFTQRLLDGGFSEGEIRGLLGENFLRVWREVRGRPREGSASAEWTTPPAPGQTVL